MLPAWFVKLPQNREMDASGALDMVSKKFTQSNPKTRKPVPYEGTPPAPTLLDYMCDDSKDSFEVGRAHGRVHGACATDSECAHCTHTVTHVWNMLRLQVPFGCCYSWVDILR